jgi:chromodomain-helicase-DNA-binding protein 7
VHFLAPLDPGSEEAADYYSVVRYPIDLGTIHNRLYNGYYTAVGEFWKDLGFMFKNTQLYYTNRLSDIRIISDTLRQIAVHLYKQWQSSSPSQGSFNLRWVSLVPSHDVTSPDFLLASIDDEPFTLQDEEDDLNINEQHLTQAELESLSLDRETDRLYLVKWKNLSYTECTWELESEINATPKISDFCRFNRALDNQQRQELTELNSHFSRILNHYSATSLGKRSRHVLTNTQHLNCLASINFPTHDFKTPVHQFSQSPTFKDGRQLREYQVVGLNWLLRNWSEGRNSILADEMGLGKTVQGISFINTLVTMYRLRGPYLIIAPLSTLTHWKKTAEDWTFLNTILYHDPNGAAGRSQCREYESYFTDIMKRGGSSKKSKLVKFHVVITSYEVFMQDFHIFMREIPFQLIMIDEAHRLKNKQAKLLSFMRELPCQRFALLTGTPLQNNTEELWSLLNFIEPERFSDMQQFLHAYGALSTTDQVVALQHELAPFLLRRLKDEVEQSIPPLQETIIDVELTNVQKTYYRAIYEKNRGFLCRGGSNPVLANMEIQLRKCCNHPYLIKGVEQTVASDVSSDSDRMARLIECSGKMVLLDKLLPKLKADGKKVLIFSQFTQMLNILEEYLHFRAYRIERLDGSVRAMERQASIDRFNNLEQLRDVFLLSTRAGGLGINLTSAQVVIIFDSDWNPQNDVQATARAHRIGQTQEVQVYRLITARTYEAQMFARASKKLGLDQAVFNKDTKHEIESLLKYGAYNILEEDASKSKQFAESNIEEILEHNSRVVDYSVIKGCYAVLKSTFVSLTADSSINIDDPNFWSKVLPPQASLAYRLLTKLNESSFDAVEEGEEFMQELQLAVSEVKEAKVNLEASSLDEGEVLSALLMQVSQSSQFSKTQRRLVCDWLSELNKPSRRSSRPAKALASAEMLSDEASDSGEEGGKKKFSSFGGTGLICSKCEREGCGWFCSGPCRRAFHTACKDSRSPTLPIADEELDPAILERLGWTCSDCTDNRTSCFICKKKAFFNCDSESQRKLQAIRCSTPSCGKFYHPSCLKDPPKKRFNCPLHNCVICGESGSSKALLQCVRCPSSFHISCYKRRVVRLNKKFIVCHNHKQPSEVPVYPSHRQELIERAKQIKDFLVEVGSKFAALSQAVEVTDKGKGRRSSDEPEQSLKRLKLSSRAEVTSQRKDAGTPEVFDYSASKEPWCRYCGCRLAVSFYKGPWGKDTLCLAHFAQWSTCKLLNLPEEAPSFPMNLEDNQDSFSRLRG